MQAARSEGRPFTVRAFVLRFVLGFVALEAVVYFLLWRGAWFEPYAELSARLAAALMRPFVDDVQAVGMLLVSPTFSLHVRPGCDGYQASAVLLAGIAALPASRADKLLGAAIGVILLQGLNVLRLVALLWTGIHHRGLFDRMHLEVLPAVFAVTALLLLFAWALWTQR